MLTKKQISAELPFLSAALVGMARHDNADTTAVWDLLRERYPEYVLTTEWGIVLPTEVDYLSKYEIWVTGEPDKRVASVIAPNFLQAVKNMEREVGFDLWKHVVADEEGSTLCGRELYARLKTPLYMKEMKEIEL